MNKVFLLTIGVVLCSLSRSFGQFTIIPNVQEDLAKGIAAGGQVSYYFKTLKEYSLSQRFVRGNECLVIYKRKSKAAQKFKRVAVLYGESPLVVATTTSWFSSPTNNSLVWKKGEEGLILIYNKLLNENWKPTVAEILKEVKFGKDTIQYDYLRSFEGSIVKFPSSDIKVINGRIVKSLPNEYANLMDAPRAIKLKNIK